MWWKEVWYSNGTVFVNFCNVKKLTQWKLGYPNSILLKPIRSYVKASLTYLTLYLFFCRLTFRELQQVIAIVSVSFFLNIPSILKFLVDDIFNKISFRACTSINTFCSFLKKRVHPLFVCQMISMWWPKNYFSRRYLI